MHGPNYIETCTKLEEKPARGVQDRAGLEWRTCSANDIGRSHVCTTSAYSIEHGVVWRWV